MGYSANPATIPRRSVELARRKAWKALTIIQVFLCFLFVWDASWSGDITAIPGLSLLPSMTWSLGLPLSGLMLLIYFWIYYLPKRFQTPTELRGWHNLVLVYLLYIAAIVIERLLPSPWDTPTIFSNYVYMIQFPAWIFVGYWLGEYPDAVSRFAKRIASITAVAAIFLSVIQYTRGDEGLFGWNWWPVRLTILFGFCYFLYGIFTLKGFQWVKATFGFACVALQILLPLHKPIVWAAAWSMLALVALWFLARKIRLLNILKVAALVLLTVVVLVQMNSNSRGQFFQEKLDYINSNWFHAGSEGIPLDTETAVRQASGGRDRIWEDVWPRFYESPLVGSGFMQMWVGRWVVQIHSFFLDFLLGIGLLGAVPFFGVLALWLVSIIRASIKACMLDLVIPLACYAIGVGGYGMIGNFTLFYVPGILAALCIGITRRLVIRDKIIYSL